MTEAEPQDLLTDERRDEFRRRGCIVLRQAIPAHEVSGRRDAIRDYVLGKRSTMSAMEQALGASATKSVFSLGDSPDDVAALIRSPRLGAIAAGLLGVDAVRVLHFSGFFKPAGGPGTPWHQDLMFIPLDTREALAIWIPLTDVTAEMGGLVFAEGSHTEGLLDPREARSRYPLAQTGNLAVGDVSVHMGWTLHASLANSSDRMREAIAIFYYADGTRVRESRGPAFNQAMLDGCLAGLAPGDVAEGPMTPVVFRRTAA